MKTLRTSILSSVVVSVTVLVESVDVSSGSSSGSADSDSSSASDGGVISGGRVLVLRGDLVLVRGRRKSRGVVVEGSSVGRRGRPVAHISALSSRNLGDTGVEAITGRGRDRGEGDELVDRTSMARKRRDERMLVIVGSVRAGAAELGPELLHRHHGEDSALVDDRGFEVEI
jgi:antitoxin (DNA-binding transcriptional repressor) of toxin-antitoxin stability system